MTETERHSFDAHDVSPAVSVVMPVYNAVAYLAECVDSLLSQTFTDFEILAFDDGSSDGSIELLQRYAKSDSRVVVHLREHCGYTPHLNEGIKIARGKYIARMDSDDICMPHRFETQVRYLENHDDVVVVGSCTVLIDENGDPYSTLKVPFEHGRIDWCHLNRGGGVLPHPSVMMRTDVVRSLGGYRTGFEPSEDLDLWLRVAEVGQLANVDEPLIRYRVHRMMTSQKRADLQRNNMIRAMNEAFRRRGMDEKDASDLCLVESSQSEEDVTPSQLALERMKTAIANGFPRTAFRYALLRLKSSPWSLPKWKDVLCCGYTLLRMRDSV